MKPRANISKLIANTPPEEAAERLARIGLDVERLAKEIKAEERERLFPGLQELIADLNNTPEE